MPDMGLFGGKVLCHSLFGKVKTHRNIEFCACPLCNAVSYKASACLDHAWTFKQMLALENNVKEKKTTTAKLHVQCSNRIGNFTIFTGTACRIDCDCSSRF